jgi:hypothetical protein
MHALAFRVMRLCKPSLHVDTATRLDLALDLLSDADAESALGGGAADRRAPDRTHLGSPVDAFGVRGWPLTRCSCSQQSHFCDKAVCHYICSQTASAD